MRPAKKDYYQLAASVACTNDNLELHYVAQRLRQIRESRHWSFQKLTEWAMQDDSIKVETTINKTNFDDFSQTQYRRFTPAKRVTESGRVRWGIWDNKTHDWSTWVFHGSYRTFKEAEAYLANTAEPSDYELGTENL